MKRSLPRLHAVTNDRILALPDLFERARVIAQAGDVALHVRSRVSCAKALIQVADRFAEIGATVFINDRADIARVVGAAGIHAPERGLPTPGIRRLVGERPWVGRSVHHPQQAVRAIDEGADYVFLGPIWATSSHPQTPPLGPPAIAAARPAVIIAIGGVTAERVPDCLRHSAYGVAVISALWDASDPASAAAELLVSLRRC